MSFETAPVIESTIAASFIARIIQSAYGFKSPVTCKLFRTAMNHLYLIDTPTDKFAFRVYTMGWRSRTEVAEEVRLLNHLKSNEISVAYPIPDTTGNFIQTFNAPEGERFGVLFSFAPGKKISTLTTNSCFNIGQTIARMHNVTENFKIARINYTMQTLLIDSFQKAATFFGNTSEEMCFVDTSTKYLTEQYQSVKVEDVRHGVVHLDIWFDNMHIDGADNITIFDFDFCGNGWLCHDIAYFMVQLYNTKKSDETHAENLRSFLKGYESLSKITEEEKRIIPMLAVSLWFFYLGIQCDRFDYWTNIFLNEDYLKRFLAIIKRWIEHNNIIIPDLVK